MKIGFRKKTRKNLLSVFSNTTKNKRSRKKQKTG